MQDNISEILSRPEVEEGELTVAHILIAYDGAGIPGVTRSRDEAETLAEEVFAMVQAGDDFDKLAQKYSDDAQEGVAGGPYAMFMASRSSGGNGAYPRDGMVPAFGNVGWKLQVGDVGVAEQDKAASPYGWHIIKRVS